MADTSVDQFNDLRPYLFAIAYRMLGTVMDAEDVLQEAYLRWQAADPEAVNSPKTYLTRIVTNLCIDVLRSAQARREQYVGPWLPEPLVADDDALLFSSAAIQDVQDQTLLAESLSTAFMVMLERLNPVERAIFLLHDIFDYDYTEIAHIVGKRVANCRQIGRRARAHVNAHRPRFEPSATKRERLFAHFIGAVADGDMSGLLNLLAEDATLWSDGGGKVAAARLPVHGADKVARFLVGLRQRGPDATIDVVAINGQPGACIYQAGQLIVAVSVHIVDEHIQGLHFIVNPDKLERLVIDR